MTEPKFAHDRFYRVFGNLIQEYVADRIWESIIESTTLRQRDKLVRKALETGQQWFGDNFRKDGVPFSQGWLQKYVEGRFLRYMRGTGPEAKVEKGKRQFEESNPKLCCEWFLVCPLTERELNRRGESLSCDHKWPLSFGGSAVPENCVWLCKKHNTHWKGERLFWGENFIPCGSFG